MSVPFHVINLRRAVGSDSDVVGLRTESTFIHISGSCRPHRVQDDEKVLLWRRAHYSCKLFIENNFSSSRPLEEKFRSLVVFSLSSRSWGATRKGKISDVRLRLKGIPSSKAIYLFWKLLDRSRRRSNEREVRIDADEIGSRVWDLGSPRDDVEIMIFGKFLVPCEGYLRVGKEQSGLIWR